MDKEKETESIIQTRARRSNAGNRLRQLLDGEIAVDADEEMKLLFEEDEEDADFKSKREVEEAFSDSDVSSEEDEYEGERDLQNENRKRKKKHQIPVIKRTKTLVPSKSKSKSTSTSTSESKSELQNDSNSNNNAATVNQPLRQSSRSSTIMHSHELQKRLAEQEQQPKVVAPKKEYKEMTLEERLEEAELTALWNIQSLTDFFEQESVRKQRQRELQASRRPKLSSFVRYHSIGVEVYPEDQIWGIYDDKKAMWEEEEKKIKRKWLYQRRKWNKLIKIGKATTKDWNEAQETLEEERKIIRARIDQLRKELGLPDDDQEKDDWGKGAQEADEEEEEEEEGEKEKTNKNEIEVTDEPGKTNNEKLQQAQDNDLKIQKPEEIKKEEEQNIDLENNKQLLQEENQKSEGVPSISRDMTESENQQAQQLESKPFNEQANKEPANETKKVMIIEKDEHPELEKSEVVPYVDAAINNSATSSDLKFSSVKEQTVDVSSSDKLVLEKEEKESQFLTSGTEIGNIEQQPPEGDVEKPEPDKEISELPETVKEDETFQKEVHFEDTFHSEKTQISKFEGPPQLVPTTTLSFLAFPKPPTEEIIKSTIFGRQSLLATRRDPNYETYLHILPMPPPTTQDFQTRATEYQNLLQLPKFGQTPVVISSLSDNDDSDSAQIRITTPAPAGVTLPNGGKKRCLISGGFANYYDPHNGIPYADVDCFKSLRENWKWIQVDAGGVNSRWKGGVGCYLVNDGNVRHAKGVPEGFE
ncbi:Vps72 protein [Martiniozyma asiatica (nom. inval.)]|nr:Vps72 protein [Martiniozyma asiatica]